MTQKVFFDTNVLLDLLLPERKSACVAAILSAVKMHKFEGQISTQSILDAKYSSRKQGIPFERFKAFYEELRRFINFGEIDPMHLDWAFEHYSGDLEDDAHLRIGHIGDEVRRILETSGFDVYVEFF